jgi:aspartate aminotransferase
MISSGANTLGQAGGVIALSSPESKLEVESMRIAFERRQELMGRLLSEIATFKFKIPEGAFYYFPDVSELFGKSNSNGVVINNADDLALYFLENAHVATVSGSAFGAPKCIRLSYATSEEQIIEAVSRIKQAVSQLI